jgi:penicillin amidase
MLKTESRRNPVPATAVAPAAQGRQRRWPRILSISAGLLLALFMTAAGAGLLWLRAAANSALPVLDGEIHLTGPGLNGAGSKEAGLARASLAETGSTGQGLKGQAAPALSAPVIVRRDAHGVPHIEAATEDSLFLAQGYVTAQDRLWQMDAFRRNANGELAEILGPALIGHDRAQRVLQIRNTAQRIYANLPAGDRARLDAYARGVNLFIAQHQDSLPAEFKLLGYRPWPWSGVDSVSIGLMMAQMLDTHWVTKLSREMIAARLHNPKLEADLYPAGSWRDHPPTGIPPQLSQPQPAPPPATGDDDDDEDDDSSQASAATPQITERSAALKGHGFSRADRPLKSGATLAAEGMPIAENAFPQGLKPGFQFRHQAARLKPRPFKTVALPSHEDTAALRALLGLPSCIGCAPGSNNWVISGKHTASGKPLLSNDMHLPLTEPNIWYMADLKANGSREANGGHGAPGYHAAGVTAPGMPFVIAGHNEHVAWGFTALYADVQDLYVEKLDGRGNYLAPGGAWKPLTVDHEVIHVRGGKNVALDVQLTAHGPLVNPLFTREKRPIALKWTLYDPALHALPLYQLNIASNWAEFSAALATWSWPTQNVVYSDDQGHIAYHAIGRVPLRPGGLMGVPIQTGGGQNAAHEWQGYIPFGAMPGAVDPPSGFLATANSRVTSGASPSPLTLEWADPYRIERIYKALEGRDQLKPSDLVALQTDVYSEVDQEMGHRFAYAIDHTPGADARLRKAASLMRAWDGRLTATSAAASLVTQARRALWPLILEPKLGADAKQYRWAEQNFAEEEIVMHASNDWLPPAYKNWDALLSDAVRKGMDEGKAPAGVARWSYGSWHTIQIEHPLARFLPFASRLAGTGPQPLSGDTTTVKQAGHSIGPSQRFTMDWSQIDGSTENIVLGESGNPLSPYFRDQWKDWYGGTTFALPFSESAVAAQTRHTLRLLP